MLKRLRGTELRETGGLKNNKLIDGYDIGSVWQRRAWIKRTAVRNIHAFLGAWLHLEIPPSFISMYKCGTHHFVINICHPTGK